MELGSSQWYPGTGKGAQTETQGIPSKHKGTLVYCVDGWIWGHVAQTGWGVSALADIPNPKQPAVGDLAWAKEVDWTTARGAFQPQLFCDSVKWIYKSPYEYKISLKLNTDLVAQVMIFHQAWTKAGDWLVKWFLKNDLFILQTLPSLTSIVESFSAIRPLRQPQHPYG